MNQDEVMRRAKRASEMLTPYLGGNFLLNKDAGQKVADIIAAEFAPAQVAGKVCGFCGKDATELRVLIKAPMGYICNECVATCATIIAKDAPAQVAPTDERSEAESMLEALRLRKELDPDAPDMIVMSDTEPSGMAEKPEKSG